MRRLFAVSLFVAVLFFIVEVANGLENWAILNPMIIVPAVLIVILQFIKLFRHIRIPFLLFIFIGAIAIRYGGVFSSDLDQIDWLLSLIETGAVFLIGLFIAVEFKLSSRVFTSRQYRTNLFLVVLPLIMATAIYGLLVATETMSEMLPVFGGFILLSALPSPIFIIYSIKQHDVQSRFVKERYARDFIQFGMAILAFVSVIVFTGTFQQVALDMLIVMILAVASVLLISPLTHLSVYGRLIILLLIMTIVANELSLIRPFQVFLVGAFIGILLKRDQGGFHDIKAALKPIYLPILTLLLLILIVQMEDISFQYWFIALLLPFVKLISALVVRPGDERYSITQRILTGILFPFVSLLIVPYMVPLLTLNSTLHAHINGVLLVSIGMNFVFLVIEYLSTEVGRFTNRMDMTFLDLPSSDQEDSVETPEEVEVTIQELRNRHGDHLTDLTDETYAFINEIESVFKASINQFHTQSERLATEVQAVLEATAEDAESQVKHRIRDHKYQYTAFIREQMTVLTSRMNHRQADAIRAYCEAIEGDLKHIRPVWAPIEHIHIYGQATDSLIDRLFKFWKRVFLRVQAFFSGRTVRRRLIQLDQIFYYHFLDEYAHIVRYTYNQLQYHNDQLIHKLINFVHEVDNQFIQMMAFIDQEAKSDAEKINYAILESRKLIENEFSLIETDFEAVRTQHQRLLTNGFQHVIDNVRTDSLVAGTFQYPSRARRMAAVSRKYQFVMAELEALKLEWSKLTEAAGGRFQLELTLLQLQSQIRRIINQAVDTLRNDLHASVSAIASKVIQDQREFITDLASDEFVFEEDALIQFKKRILYSLKINSLKKIENLKSMKTINQFAEHLLTQIHSLVQQLPKQVRIVSGTQQRITENQFPRNVVLYYVPVRQIVKSHLEIEISQNLNEMNSQIAIGMEHISQQFDDLIRFVDEQITVNLGKEERDQVVAEYRKQVQSIMEMEIYVSNIIQSVDQKIVTEIIQSIKRIQTDVIEDVEPHLRRQSEDDGPSGSTVVTRWLLTIPKRMYRSIRSITEQIRDVIQAEPMTETTSVSFNDIRDQVDQGYRKIQDLPFVYRKLIHLKPVEIQEFLDHREHITDRLEKSFHDWLRGEFYLNAVYGHTGSGKTSLINILLKYEFNQVPTCRVKLKPDVISEATVVHQICNQLNISESDSFEALKRVILSQERRQIIIVESVSRLIQLDQIPYELLHHFLEFCRDTARYIFWIHTFNICSWRFLEKRIRLSQYYQIKLELPHFKLDELKQTFLLRNRLSGYETEFIHPDVPNIYKLRHQFTMVDDERLETAYYFDELYQYSDGNPYLATFYWLSSIRTNDQKKFEIHPVTPFSPDIWPAMSEHHLLVLLYLLIFNGRTADQIENLFPTYRNSIHELMRELEFARILRLKKGSESDYLVVEPVFEVPVFHELERRGMI